MAMAPVRASLRAIIATMGDMSKKPMGGMILLKGASTGSTNRPKISPAEDSLKLGTQDIKI